VCAGVHNRFPPDKLGGESDMHALSAARADFIVYRRRAQPPLDCSSDNEYTGEITLEFKKANMDLIYSTYALDVCVLQT